MINLKLYCASQIKIRLCCISHEALYNKNFILLHVTVANEALIAVWVVQGHRPALDAIPADAPRELIDIIKICWDDDPKARPNFQGTRNKTKSLIIGKQ